MTKGIYHLCEGFFGTRNNHEQNMILSKLKYEDSLWEAGLWVSKIVTYMRLHESLQFSVSRRSIEDGHFSIPILLRRTHTCRQNCLRKTFLTISSQCLDRFRSFFRFYKSQYYFLNVIFYEFFYFDISKMFCEQFYVREWEEMYSKWYLPRNSTDLKSAAPVCKSIY
jgi:hypothetical protein